MRSASIFSNELSNLLKLRSSSVSVQIKPVRFLETVCTPVFSGKDSPARSINNADIKRVVYSRDAGKVLISHDHSQTDVEFTISMCLALRVLFSVHATRALPFIFDRLSIHVQ